MKRGRYKAMKPRTPPRTPPTPEQLAKDAATVNERRRYVAEVMAKLRRE